MNELTMCKKFAELEGVEVFENDHGVLCYMPPRNVICAMIHTPYNPITDLALNCAARDKYGIDIVYSLDYMSDPSCSGYTKYRNKSDIPRAVIECILKSEGLWK